MHEIKVVPTYYFCVIDFLYGVYKVSGVHFVIDFDIVSVCALQRFFRGLIFIGRKPQMIVFCHLVAFKLLIPIREIS